MSSPSTNQHLDTLSSSAPPEKRPRGGSASTSNKPRSNNNSGSSRRREESADVVLSKNFSKILRHKALDHGLEMADDGYVSLQALLALPTFSKVTLQQVCDVVWSNEKKRFQLFHVPSQRSIDSVEDLDAISGSPVCSAEFSIRAVQGHTIATLKDEALLTAIDADWLARQPTVSSSGEFLVYHGTYRRCLGVIAAEGLKTMGRNHIHFAPALPEANSVISGMRKSCEVVIVVDVCRLVADGIAVFVSQNGVFLTRGVADSDCLPPTFFKQIVARDGLELPVGV